MKSSGDRILTSHVGSLPRPDALIAANARREQGQGGDEAAFQKLLAAAVNDVVKRQQSAGIAVPNDGEFGKSMGQAVNYRAWLSYAFARLSGLQIDNPPAAPPRLSGADDFALVGLERRRDRAQFAAAYADPHAGVSMGPGAAFVRPVCVGPVKYTGREAIAADIARFKAGLAAAGIDEGFMTSIAPGSVARLGNLHYKTDEEFLFACADAMREEYKAIVDAGIVLQLDDPGIAENWDQIVPAPSVEAYRRFTMRRVEALNHAIAGLPPDRIRFHLCWGSWHGPHTTDLPMRDIVDVMLKIKVGAYSFEAANVRHEHEYAVWREVKLPDDKLMLPGIVSHATNVVEHPELVAERIRRFADIVGKERVIASTDCGLGGRIHPDIAWAKLEALAQGAALASKQLWR
ncbi:MAG TPA: cobalamin-independent methionine synthase II family protein [Stellaceae bacterium]|nr:cobalamin-independent methionine synthase II family protein [Stellaceae bacterium]